MTDVSAPQEFWERKILVWEKARYSQARALYPLSWSVRARLKRAEEILRERTNTSTRVLELACGSGLLAERLRGHIGGYRGIDIAANAIGCAKKRVPEFQFVAGDVLTENLPTADITVFLGLTDWLDERGMETLFAKIKSPKILFSYTQTSLLSPYRLYRLYMDKPKRSGSQSARTYEFMRIRELLAKNGYAMESLTRPYLLNPGSLVWGERRP